MSVASMPGMDFERLTEFLRRPLEVGDGSTLEADLIEGGRSNLTYLLSGDGRSWVLRRPPLGHSQPTAHNMRREFEVLTGLSRTAVPAPAPILFCEEGSVVGSPFYLMEFAEGDLYREPEDVEGLDRRSRRSLSKALISTLTKIHLADYEAAGLGSLGRPEGFLQRQVERWTGQLESGIEVSAGLRELAGRLAGSVPGESRSSLVHGDFRIDNVIFESDDPGEVAAVLDWEMATIGDPLADLGMFLMYWRHPGERCASSAHEISAREGFPTREELVETYRSLTGFEVELLDFYEVLAHFKLAVIVEGIRVRHKAGETVGDSFGQIEGIPASLVETALELADGSTIPGLNGRTG